MKMGVVDCSHHVFHSFPPSVPSSHSTHYSCRRMYETNTILLSDLFASKTLPKRQTSTRISRGHSIRRSCSLNLDDIEGSGRANGEKSTCHGSKKMHHATSESPFTDDHGSHQDSSLLSRYDFSEPVVFRIRPEYPDWPDQDTFMPATTEPTVKSFDIPLSLRMIKKKLLSEEGFTGSQQPAYCSVKAAFASMVFIIVELQRYESHMREALCHENLDIITSKVQKDTHSSFVWLFQQVFSTTPSLMLHVMMLLANFSLYSASHNIAMAEALPTGTTVKSAADMLSIEEKQIETNLWISMVEEMTKMQPLDRAIMQQFVSPVSVELEPDDDYEEYLGTDILYKMNLTREPNNPLLLCNYAQFLHLVAHDHDRAEECLKKAIRVSPPDAESLNQYAKFLHKVRMDLSGAEEMFLQALSVEPDNSYYVSTYANFLWSTGGDETCFPLDNSDHNPNS